MQKRSRSRWTLGVVALTLAIPAGVTVFVEQYTARDAAITQSFANSGMHGSNPMVDGARAGGIALVVTFVGLFLLLEVVMRVLRRKDADGPSGHSED